MAPKNPKQSTYLKKCVIAVAGSLGKDAKISDIEKWSVNNGGTFKSKVDNRTTHVICSWETYTKNDFALPKKYAHMKKLQIVEWAWLEDTLHSKRVRVVTKYLHSRKCNTKTQKKDIRRKALLTGKTEDEILQEQNKEAAGPIIASDIEDDDQDDAANDDRSPIIEKEEELISPAEDSDTTEEDISDRYKIYQSTPGNIYQVAVQGSDLTEQEDGNYILSCHVSIGKPKHYIIQWQYDEAGQEVITGEIISTTDLDVALTNFSAWYENKTGEKWSELDEGCMEPQEAAVTDFEAGTRVEAVKELSTQERMWLFYQNQKQLGKTGGLHIAAQQAEFISSTMENGAETSHKITDEDESIIPDHGKKIAEKGMS